VLILLACTVVDTLATRDVLAQAYPSPGHAELPSTQELLRRLEAAEQELAYLRMRGRQQAEWEQATFEPLPAVPVAQGRTGEKAVSPESAPCVCGCCGTSKPVCQGVGPLCQLCKEKLSWNKGPWRIVPFGFLTGEVIGATSSTRSRPMILYIEEGLGSNEQFTVHGQTTALGFNFAGPRVGSFQLGGMILFNLLGDRPALNQATPFFLRGYGELKNDYWRFAFGQQGDLFNPLNPVTVNFGGHKQAGNGGSFRGSLRVERFIRPSDVVQWTLQGAISQQVVTDFVVDPRIVGTDNGWPNVETRLGLGLGRACAGARPIELGVSGVIGETRAFGLLGEGVFTTWGVSADAQFRAQRWGTRGEFFIGQAIGTYNLGIGQSLDPTGFRAIRSVGGWGDVWYKLTPCLTAHVGYGIDDPRDGDVGQFLDDNLNPVAGQRSRNEVIWANLIWDVTNCFDVAFEVSYRETDYVAPSESNTAMIYHFRSRLKF
jgi:hypothetical protein